VFNHKDRVTCTNPKLKDKVFTVYLNTLDDTMRLYQVSDSVLFNLEGFCIQSSYKSLFKIGDKLEPYKSNNDYKNSKVKTKEKSNA
jgi:hypothetical protein